VAHDGGVPGERIGDTGEDGEEDKSEELVAVKVGNGC
jgi:hypothetical protein